MKREDNFQKFRRAERFVNCKINKDQFFNKVTNFIQNNQTLLRHYIEKEINKGTSVNDAINYILDSNIMLKRYPELLGLKFRREVKNAFRNDYFRREKELIRLKEGEER